MEEMNQAEVARDETEQKMIYKFLLRIAYAIRRAVSIFFPYLILV